MAVDAEAERIRSLVLLRAACDTALARLDQQDVADLALSIEIGDLCTSLSDELERFAHRHEPATGPPPG
jgi:hypothetical protein